MRLFSQRLSVPQNLLVLFTCATSLAMIPPPNANADQVKLDVKLVNPTMKAGEKQTNYLRVSLTGFELKSDQDRSPVNVAIVLDRSGSMQGEKLRQAKEAAMAAIDRLSNDDIVSVVLYDTEVEVLVPATKAVDRQLIKAAIRKIEARQKTALFAGVSKGAAEVRKFLEKDRVNRVILLSDGLANVGPRSPQDLEGLGRSLIKEGVSVSTLGLGLNYNEDLMVGLASVGGGNHAFIESAEDLVAIFNQEFDGLLSVVANQFEIEVTLHSSVRPVRLIGCEGDIEGQSVRIPLAQLYANQQRYFILETEVSSGDNGDTRDLAEVSVRYRNLKTETEDQLTSKVQVRFSDSAKQVEEDRDVETFAYCTLQITNLRSREATALRDAGQVDAAKKLLDLNVSQLRGVEATCRANGVTEVLPQMEIVRFKCVEQAEAISDQSKWTASRKDMRALQNSIQQQQTYGGFRKTKSVAAPSKKN